ncbi:MAG TPA: acyl-CoA carboxylase subunit beta, partial [Saprospiraceae bacterium]|nr:acyl-CoA carboxylase subunit beta [Saprospiraceae bacterium]
MENKIDIEVSKNEDSLKLEVSRIKRLMQVIEKGGGEKRLEKIRSQGKMTARERIEYLLDK